MAATTSSPTSMGELLGAFAFASDLAFGLQLEDSLKSCFVATTVAEHLGLPEDERLTVYYAALLNHAGCTSWTSELATVWQADEIVARRELILFTDRSSHAGLEAWLHQYVAPDLPGAARAARLAEAMENLPQVIADAISATAEVAGRIARRLGMPMSVRKATRHTYEQWDGSGAPDGLKGDDVPLASRIVLPAFILVPTSRTHGRDVAISALRRGAGTTFDPAVIDSLSELSNDEEFWEVIEGEGTRERVLALEPRSPLSEVGEERIDDIALAFADFIDLKSRYAAAHSRRVGKVAEQIARLMACAPPAVAQIRRAALMHDLGLVAIPSFSLEKPAESLSEAERERYRLHPYHGERILSRVPALAPLAEMVGSHDERVDGSGAYRGLRGANVSLGARIIAVAARLDELTHDAPGHKALSFEAALGALETDAGLDPSIIRVVRTAAGEQPGGPAPRVPGGLTPREVEVLQLVARGMTRAQIGGALGVTENTVRHHLEHIYGKVGTSTRVGATLFAIENGLLD